MNDPKNPRPGSKVIDASEVELIDLPGEKLPYLIKAREGFELAIEAVINLTPEQRARAGISEVDVVKMEKMALTRRRALAFQPAAEKLAEMADDTARFEAHRIGRLLSEFAAQARRRAEDDPESNDFMAALEKLFEYQFGPAVRAAKTRAAQADEAAEESPGEQ
jgi:hypothetical protein